LGTGELHHEPWATMSLGCAKASPDGRGRQARPNAALTLCALVPPNPVRSTSGRGMYQASVAKPHFKVSCNPGENGGPPGGSGAAANHILSYASMALNQGLDAELPPSRRLGDTKNNELRSKG